MPDLHTEMQKILHAWEQPETTEQPKETTVFKPTTNTSRTAFEIVRDNPYKTKREYIKLLEQQGFKSSSTSSLISQMTRQGMLSVDDMGLMHATQNEYRPLKTAKAYAKQTKKVKTSKLRTSEPVIDSGIARLVKQPYRTKIQTILDDISLNDAHELYRELHTYFGGLSK
jgi:hypothetical protein